MTSKERKKGCQVGSTSNAAHCKHRFVIIIGGVIVTSKTLRTLTVQLVSYRKLDVNERSNNHQKRNGMHQLFAYCEFAHAFSQSANN